MVVKAEANGIGGKNGRTTVAVKMLKGLFLFKNCISYIAYATFILANLRSQMSGSSVMHWLWRPSLTWAKFLMLLL